MRRTIQLLFAAIFIIGLLVGCGGQQKDSAENGKDESPKQKMIMATSADYPPYEDVDIATGEIVGFDVDIAKYIASRLNFEMEIVNIDFNGLLSALQAGKADFIMAGMTPDEERKKNADFTDIYYDATNTIVTKKGSNLKKLEDLKGKKVGVQLGSIQEEAARKVQGAEVKALNQVPEIIQEIKSGRIDAAIIEDTVAKGYTRSNNDLEFTPVPHEGESGSAIALPKGSEWTLKFNEVLNEMKDNGEMEKLIVKWFDKK